MGLLRRSSAPKGKARMQQRDLLGIAHQMLRHIWDVAVMRDIHAAYWLLDDFLKDWERRANEPDSLLDDHLREWRAALTDEQAVARAMRVCVFSIAGKTDDLPAAINELTLMYPWEEQLRDVYEQLAADFPELNDDNFAARNMRWTRASVEALLQSADVPMPLRDDGAPGYTNLPFLMFWATALHESLVGAHKLAEEVMDTYGEDRGSILLKVVAT